MVLIRIWVSGTDIGKSIGFLSLRHIPARTSTNLSMTE